MHVGFLPTAEKKVALHRWLSDSATSAELDSTFRLLVKTKTLLTKEKEVREQEDYYAGKDLGEILGSIERMRKPRFG
uniref:Uncharacterized protein n=1 Tax=Plectus sambesii TaxID=2011161 RepID=A0A914VNZ0_9BILA